MLRIAKGGKLYYRYMENNRWRNVTDYATSFLTITPNNICTIDEDVTLNDVFKLIRKNEDIFTKILHPKFKDFLSEIKKKPTGECNDFDFLEIYWSPFFSDGEMDDGIYIHLIKDPKKITGNFEEDCPCSMLFTAINEMKNIPMRLNRNYNIRELYKEKDLVKLKRDFYLMDILSCIMWNISWFGAPEERVNELKKIGVSIDE